jgi:hypothetical protein
MTQISATSKHKMLSSMQANCEIASKEGLLNRTAMIHQMFYWIRFQFLALCFDYFLILLMFHLCSYVIYLRFVVGFFRFIYSTLIFETIMICLPKIQNYQLTNWMT